MTTIFMKKYFYLLLLFAFIGFSYSGCAKKDTDSALIHLKYLMWGDPNEIEAVKKNLSQFEREHPNIKVSIYHAQGGLAYTQKIQTLAAGGILPDVMYVDSWDFPEYVRKGLFLPLSDSLKNERSDFLLDFFPELLSIFQYEGELYGIPKDFATIMVYTNRDLFDKAGLSPPSSSWSWDDFLQIAQKLTLDSNQDGFVDQYGVDLQLDVMRLAPWLWQNGGGLADEKGNFTFGKEPFRQANIETLSFLHDLVHRYKVAPAPFQSRDQNLFETGRVAMVFGGRWLSLPYKKIKRFQWDMVTVPSQKEKGTTLVTVCYAISSRSQHPKEAWELVRFLTSTKAQKYVANSGHAVPSLKSVAWSKAFLEASELPLGVNNQASLDGLSFSRTLPLVPKWRQIENILQQELSGYLSQPNAQASALTDRIQNKVEKIWPSE